MTRRLRVLARLGVMGVAASAVIAGAVPATQAAPTAYTPTGLNVTGVTITTGDQTTSVGVCTPYAVALTTQGGSSGGSITVELTQPVPADSDPNATGDQTPSSMTIGFCDPQHDNDSQPTFTNALVAPDDTAGSTSDGPGTTTCTASASSGSLTAGKVVGCETTFADGNGDNVIVVGLASDQPGQMTMSAFADTDGSGNWSASEPHDTAVQTWHAPVTPYAVDCSPNTDSSPTGTKHTWACTVTDASSGQYLVPDQKVAWNVLPADVASGYNPPDATAHGTCTTGDNQSASTANDPGVAQCSLTNNGRAGTDVIHNWVEMGTESPPVQEDAAVEKSDDISETWVEPAGSGASLSLSCSPGQATSGANPTCSEPTSQQSVTITATAKDSSGQTMSGVLVTFDQPSDASGSAADSGDSETVSPTSCTTGTDGTCQVTFTDSSPQTDEKFTVTGHLARAGQSDASATATIQYGGTTPADARNISVKPTAVTKDAGSTQKLTATVIDRDSHAVSGVLVTWSEDGPGTFTNGTSSAQCTTGADGTCAVAVTSTSSDRGEQTVTATIDPSNYPKPGTLSNNKECDAPADQTYVAPDSSAMPGTATGAPAGNCSAQSTVTWQAGSAPAPTYTLHITGKSPKRHRIHAHVWTGRAALAGTWVGYWFWHHGHKHWLGHRHLNRKGAANSNFDGIHSGWSVVVHCKIKPPSGKKKAKSDRFTVK